MMCLAISLIPIGIIGGILYLIPVETIGGIQGFRSTSTMLICLFAAVTFVFSIMIAYFISRPIEKLTKNIDKISKGKLDVELENSEIYEINKLTDSLNRVMTSLKLAIHKVGVKKGEIFEETVKEKEAVEEKYHDERENKKSVKKIDNIMGQPEVKWSEQKLDSVFIFDENANILDCNENMYKQLGYTKGEMLSSNMADFDALESKDNIIGKINEVRKLGSIISKTIYKKKNGSIVFVSECMECLSDKNMFKCIVREDYQLNKP